MRSTKMIPQTRVVFNSEHSLHSRLGKIEIDETGVDVFYLCYTLKRFLISMFDSPYIAHSSSLNHCQINMSCV
jgi:hypothetical protein